jgi:hypothetical protein
MKIFKVKPDTKFRLMYPEDKVYDSAEWEFKGQPLMDALPHPFNAYFAEDSNKPLPDIAYLGMTTFAFRSEVATELVDILEAAGELIPFKIGEDAWYCLNVTNSCDALDEDKSKYKINNGAVKLILLEYSFDTAKLSDQSLFKIHNDNYTEIFCADRRETDEQVLDNFFCAVAGHGYTGLKFEEVYSEGE